MTQDDKRGKLVLDELQFFLDTTNDFINSQPSPADLHATADWLTKLNAVYASWATMNGKAESLFSRLAYHEISTLPEDEYKKVKSSSTLTDLYIKGKYPTAAKIYSEILVLGKVLASIGDNTRTLIASFRLEREIDSKGVRQV